MSTEVSTNTSGLTAQPWPADLAPAAPLEGAESLPKRGSRARRRGAVRVEDVALAAYPIAHLLPPEVVATGKVRTTRRLMTCVVAAVLLLSVAAGFGAHVYAQGQQQQLAGVEAQNSTVLAQEGKYASVRTDQSKVQLAQAAQRVGAATEIDWSAYFAKVEALLPQGVSVTDISGQTASPMTPVTQDSAPLSAGRAAVVTVTVSAPSATTIADATDAFRQLPGYAGAVIGAITEGAGSASAPASAASAATAAASSPSRSTSAAAASGWTAPITISLTPAAFSGRFAAPSK